MYTITINNSSGEPVLVGFIKDAIAQRLMTYLRAIVKSSKKETLSDT